MRSTSYREMERVFIFEVLLIKMFDTKQRKDKWEKKNLTYAGILTAETATNHSMMDVFSWTSLIEMES